MISGLAHKKMEQDPSRSPIKGVLRGDLPEREKPLRGITKFHEYHRHGTNQPRLQILAGSLASSHASRFDKYYNLAGLPLKNSVQFAIHT